jgi:hypothetical protein
MNGMVGGELSELTISFLSKVCDEIIRGLMIQRLNIL